MTAGEEIGRNQIEESTIGMFVSVLGDATDDLPDVESRDRGRYIYRARSIQLVLRLVERRAA